jgi:hypothetical protein
MKASDITDDMIAEGISRNEAIFGIKMDPSAVRKALKNGGMGMPSFEEFSKSAGSHILDMMLTELDKIIEKIGHCTGIEGEETAQGIIAGRQELIEMAVRNCNTELIAHAFTVFETENSLLSKLSRGSVCRLLSSDMNLTPLRHKIIEYHEATITLAKKILELEKKNDQETNP